MIEWKDTWTAEELDALRESVRSTMSEKRFVHTAAVEQMAMRLADLYAPEKKTLLRVAALLHDVTKEYTTQQHMAICHEHGIPCSMEDERSPKTFHAKTAAVLIPERYPCFAHPEVMDCVRWHTTGRKDMSLCEKIIYLADYIDESRKFKDCVILREYFWSAHPEAMEQTERLRHLNRTMIISYDMTMRGLMEDGSLISPDTVLARNDLLLK
jgi:nicotinate-nucleotide adenylyltransferase